MKAIFFSNFDAGKILSESQLEGHSAHHLWGKTKLDKYNIYVDILADRKYSFLQLISEKLKVLGDLDRELRVFLTKNQYDLVYTVNPLVSSLLALLRLFGLFDKPIVTVANMTLKQNLPSKLIAASVFRGYDKILCLNEAIKSSLIEDFQVAPEKLEVLSWCIDIGYHKLRQDTAFEPDNCKYIISTGKTYRDYKTLINAFQNIDYDLEILGSSLDRLQAKKLKNITIDSQFIPTPKVIEKFHHAYAVAIPLLPEAQSVYNAIGLTSLLEAMAMSRPVIVTKYDFLGIDVEKEGIGLTVAPGDVAGWQEAINYLLDNPDLAKNMGQKGRQLVEEKYNLDVFTEKLAQQIYSLQSL